MALALYRKYRPRTFAEIIGQEHVTEPLSQALRSGRLHHAYLFSGPRGCGKTSSARILARSLNCERGPTPEPCGVCASCKSLANDGAGSIDVIEIDAASHGGVDDARDLREKAFFAPASSRYKIYVIDEAHMVSSAGFNALLKLVEEPPDYVKFIFATTEPEKVLGTIRSRTHHYPFRLIPPAVLRPYLQQLTEAEGVHVEPAVLPLVVRAGGGSARDSLSVLDQLIAGAGPEGVSYSRAVALLGVTDVALIDEMCDALAAGDGAAAYGTIDRVAEAGHDPRRFASDLLERFRDLIVLQQVPDAVSKGLIDGPVDQLDAMSAQATRLGPATLSRCADIVHNGLVEMRGTTAPRLLLELITARMLLPGAEDSTGALLQRLERMERRLTLSADQDPTDFVRPQPASPSAAQASGESGASSGGGLSAARAAAAAAGRRAPAGQQPVASGDVEAQAPPAQSSPDASAGSDAGAVTSAAPEAEARTWPDAVDPARTAAEGPGRPDAGSSGRPDARPGRGAADSVTDDDLSGSGGRDPGASDRVGAVARDRASTAAPDYDDSAARGWAEEPEPVGIMPDAPEESGVQAAPTGQLSAAAIREVWPEIMIAVGRKSKKIAALAQGATVRELEGQTVVLTFRFPAHAKMVAAEPALLSDALYEALGGRWQIRCDVAGEAGPSPGSSGSGRGGASQGGSGPRGGGAGSAQAADPRRAQPAGGAARVADPQDVDGDVEPGDDPWGSAGNAGGAQSRDGAAGGSVGGGGQSSGGPSAGGQGSGGPSGGGQGGTARSAPSQAGPGRSEPHRPGQDGSGQAGRGQNVAPAQARSGQSPASARREPSPQAPPADDGDDWPEPARLGGSGSDSTGSDGDDRPEPASPPEDDWPEPARAGGAATSNGVDISVSNAGQGAAASARPGGGAHPVDSPPAARDGASATADGRSRNGDAAPGAGRTPPSPAPSNGPAAGRPAASSGLAAARAAAANAGKAGTAPAPAAPANTPFSDGSAAAEEPPYDPDYDGPVRGAPGYEGFDPGDEPLDDVIDERTARQSSEQQAMQLLQDAFGAEKISEI